jgi:ribosomal protein L40E
MIAGRTRAALEREKTLVLRSIKELEFDFAMGKVAKADFDEMSVRLRQRAMGLMKQLDAGGGYKEQIAKEVERRLEGDGFSRRLEDDHGTAAAEAATAEAVALQASTCSQCETPNDDDAKFCKNCGAKL